MSDLIDRQAAIDGADAIIARDTSGNNDVVKAMAAWKRYVEALPSAQPEPQWIPCSERLPEDDGEMYLVTDYCEQINRRRLHISYCYVNREGFWSDVPMGYKVVAWMPLPKPWKGEKDETDS